jgi:hypothetical protein
VPVFCFEKVDERGMRWFYTGDIGQFHADGCLEIIDRRKDIVKLQHGEYVSLGKVSIYYHKMLVSITFLSGLMFSLQVEAALIVSPYVDNMMLHADPFHSYCVALIVVAQPVLEEWASKRGIAFTSFAELCEKEEAIKEVQASLVKVCPFDHNVLISRLGKGASECLAYVSTHFNNYGTNYSENFGKQHLCNALEFSDSDNKASGYKNTLMKCYKQAFGDKTFVEPLFESTRHKMVRNKNSVQYFSFILFGCCQNWVSHQHLPCS